MPDAIGGGIYASIGATSHTKFGRLEHLSGVRVTQFPKVNSSDLSVTLYRLAAELV